MNMVEKKLYNISPRYLDSYEDLLRRYAQFGGGARDERYVSGKYFSNVYEFYMFAFFIGIYKNIQTELTGEDKLKTFWEVKNWQPADLVDNLLVCAIAKSDFQMLEVQSYEEAKVTEEVAKLRKTIEEYANGGFKYISEKIESDPDQAEQDDFFIRMLSESKGSQ